MRQARRIVQEYLLGELLFIRIEYYQSKNALRKPNEQASLDIGVSDCTAELGIPAYELLRFIVGKPAYRLMACFAQASKDQILDDSSYVTIEMEEGAYASMCLSKTSLNHDNCFSIELEGSSGSLRWCNETCDVRAEERSHE